MPLTIDNWDMPLLQCEEIINVVDNVPANAITNRQLVHDTAGMSPTSCQLSSGRFKNSQISKCNYQSATGTCHCWNVSHLLSAVVRTLQKFPNKQMQLPIGNWYMTLLECLPPLQMQLPIDNWDMTLLECLPPLPMLLPIDNWDLTLLECLPPLQMQLPIDNWDMTLLECLPPHQMQLPIDNWDMTLLECLPPLQMQLPIDNWDMTLLECLPPLPMLLPIDNWDMTLLECLPPLVSCPNATTNRQLGHDTAGMSPTSCQLSSGRYQNSQISKCNYQSTTGTCHCWNVSHILSAVVRTLPKFPNKQMQLPIDNWDMTLLECLPPFVQNASKIQSEEGVGRKLREKCCEQDLSH
ncbi:hypothetical protein J6590_072000 [Homalodisca vitripennis]|nr:hypothetical protein J6590_072000 [Homalodisca vitripennis]